MLLPRMRTREAILAAVAQALSSVPEVLDAYVFGSVGRDEMRPDSDVDVAVSLVDPTAPAPTFGWRAELATRLMKALQRNDVDVVLLHEAPPLLQRRVLGDGVRVFSRDLLESTRRGGRMMSRWCDWAPVQARIDAAILER